MKPVAGALVAAVMMLLAGTAAAGPPLPQSDDPWFRAGREALAQARRLGPVNRRARNVILFVGDGMGVSTVTAARIFEGQLRGETGEENLLSFERMPYLALAKTYSTNMQVSDSAATAVAMMTGIKTKSGVLGLDSGVTLGDCGSAEGRRVTTALELAETLGMATGVVSTASITHATPAAAYAHSPSRGWETDARLPEEAREGGCRDIALQLLEIPYGDGLEVALGGGRVYFLPESASDPEREDVPGARIDGRDLTREWTERRKGAVYVWSLEQFDGVDPDATGPLLGLFQPWHLRFEADRAQDTAGEPSLSAMTEKAIRVLSRDPDGYFLMVEGGRIDHAHHDGNAHRALVDTVEFARAVQVALDRTDAADTLILVTADHSHVLTIAGYPPRGNPILGVVEGVNRRGERTGEPAAAADKHPYTVLGYANGPGFLAPEDRKKLWEVDTTALEYRQQAAVPMRGETHAGEDVAVYARGPGAHLIRGVVEQNYLFHVMDEAAQLSRRAAARSRE